jgi:hypothetical protein
MLARSDTAANQRAGFERGAGVLQRQSAYLAK